VQLLPAAHASLRRCWWFWGWSTSFYAALTSFAPMRNLKRRCLQLDQATCACVIGIGSFSALGTSGAMLQMVSMDLIGAASSAWLGLHPYDRTHTCSLDEVWAAWADDVAQDVRLWTVCSWPRWPYR